MHDTNAERRQQVSRWESRIAHLILKSLVLCAFTTESTVSTEETPSGGLAERMHVVAFC